MKKSVLLVLLVGQLLGAGALRWHVTTDTLRTEYDYLLAQEVIAGDNWHREGAVSRHFVPSRSIDQLLPEWAYRDDYWRDYLSQPPLSFMLQYAVMRLFPTADPVVAGKLLAQLQIGCAILGAGVLLLDVFGFAGALAGMSFLIWGRPFLMFFVDGYYSTTPAMMCVLLLVAWALVFFRHALINEVPAVRARRYFVVAGLFAYGGVMSEWIALFSNAITVAVFSAIAAAYLLKRCARRAKRAFFFAAAVGVGSAAAIATTIVLYGTKVGFAFFWRQLMSRVDERTAGVGAVGAWQYTSVLFDRMQRCWPRGMLLVLTGITAVLIALAIVQVAGRGTRGRADGQLVLLAVVLAFGGPIAYCYRLQDLVTIHWWFAGTFAVAWATTVCALTFVVHGAIARISRGPATRTFDALASALIVAAGIAWNLQYASLSAKEGAVAEGTVLTPSVKASHDLYRAIGGALPRDYEPLVVVDMPELFDHYPFVTAYVRHPIVRMSASGALLKLGTSEDAGPALLQRGGSAYVAYDRSLRVCAHPDATPASWRYMASLAFCRVPVEALVTAAHRVFRDAPADNSAVFTEWASRIVPPGCCDATGLLDLTRLVDSRLRLRSGEAIDDAAHATAHTFQAVIAQWQSSLGGTVHVVDPRFADAFLMGIVADGDRWFLLLVNRGPALPDFQAGLAITVNGTPLEVLTPYQQRSTDGKTLLPFTLIATRALPGVPPQAMTLELLDRGAVLMRTTNVTPKKTLRDGGVRQAERDALVFLSTGCTNPPGAPVELRVVPSPADRIRLTWSGASGGPFSYVLQGGSSPGAMNVTNSDLGDTATRFEAAQIPAGTYYVRIRGRNACGDGPPSNEMAATVR